MLKDMQHQRKKKMTFVCGTRRKRRKRKECPIRSNGFWSVKSDASLNLQNKWSHSNGVTRKVVMDGYSGFATCKELKLSGSQRMYVVFAKDDQGSGLGLGDALEVEDGMCVQRLFGF
ncbi:hypothetical protein F2Q69_00026434 [Brassica cretica]|uniref:Uncharacterized protein n=1 Tax=Brassica cretica TaxID=69181 RepID=A0A8S9S812_BRACR|nr:hypothetical protein F2Q69_00026434 [Brassica cretica]